MYASLFSDPMSLGLAIVLGLAGAISMIILGLKLSDLFVGKVTAFQLHNFDYQIANLEDRIRKADNPDHQEILYLHNAKSEERKLLRKTRWKRWAAFSISAAIVLPIALFITFKWVLVIP